MGLYVLCDAAEMLLHLHHKGRRSEEDERWRRRQGGGRLQGGVAVEREERAAPGLASGARFKEQNRSACRERN